jgi:membrane protein implicated in regulation of membrane protease activity
MSRLTTIEYMPYMLIGGVAVVSLGVILLLGLEVWFVPVIVLPFAVLYLLFDRHLRDRERERDDATAERRPGD